MVPNTDNAVTCTAAAPIIAYRSDCGMPSIVATETSNAADPKPKLAKPSPKGAVRKLSIGWRNREVQLINTNYKYFYPKQMINYVGKFPVTNT